MYALSERHISCESITLSQSNKNPEIPSTRVTLLCIHIFLFEMKRKMIPLVYKLRVRIY